MGYDRQILEFLLRVGERGISVRSLAKHVYNQNHTFFSTPDYKQVHDYVQRFLLRNSKSPQSLITRTERRGYYRLNTQGNADAHQLLISFKTEPDDGDEKEEKPQQDFSLDLFV